MDPHALADLLTDEDEVTDWLAPRTHRASGVTMREAVRYLPVGDKDRLMQAYREKRPAPSGETA